MTDPPITVYKFGGTSLADGARIDAAARLVVRNGRAPVVVVSALAGVTSRLEALGTGGPKAGALAALEERHRTAAGELAPEGADPHVHDALMARLAAIFRGARETLERAADGREAAARRRDALVAVGEDLSVELVAAALRNLGAEAVVVDAREVVRTGPEAGASLPRDETTVRLARERLAPLLERGTIPVMQGFIGADESGRTTTLGRGGSDFTAAIVGAALGASEVTIWTDVDGIFSADPGEVPGARVLPELGYEEAVELAYFGARVIHPAAAKHAVGRRVALRIRNSFDPEAPGTLVRPDTRRSPGVAALAHKSGTVLIRVRSRPHFMAHGFLARVFGVLSRHRVPVDLVATSHTSTAFTVDRGEELRAVRHDLSEIAEVEVVEGLGTVSVIGHGLLELPGISGEIFRVLDSERIRLISQATDTSLSFLVEGASAPGIVRRLHEALIEDPGRGNDA